MGWKTGSVLAAVVFLLVGHGLALEPPYYRPVSSGELLDGRVRDGDSIEVAGHAWLTEKGMFFNASEMSARGSMEVDVANVSSATVGRLKADCSAPGRFGGGCRVTLRGQPARRAGRQVFVGAEVEIMPRR